MAVYKIFASSDATVYSSDVSKNTGLDEILEVVVKNNNASTNGLYLTSYVEDIRRSLIQFSNTDLSTVKSLSTGSSFQANLRLFLSSAENLSTTYSLEFRQISQSWDMGTGKFIDYPETINGVCWNSPNAYVTQSSTTWSSISSSYYTIAGGGSWTELYVTQSFGYADNKDVNADVSPIVSSWFSGSFPNYGILVKFPTPIENNSGSYIQTKFFSTDTHTIYPPRLATRSTFPTRQFATSSVYLNTLLLPSSSYWAIQDYKTEEMVVDFDTNYTKISSDGTYNYFDLYMNGLEPERFYKLLVQTVLPSTNETINIDSNLIFKIVR